MDFLMEHQKIVSDLLGKPKDYQKLQKRIDVFLLKINSAIEAHNYDYQGLKHFLQRKDEMIIELCRLRDLMMSQRKEEDDGIERPSGENTST